MVEGHPLAYDFATGFGLVLPLGRLDVPMLKRGSAESVAEDDDVYVVGHGGRAHALKATCSRKREFAGFWEYLLDSALFTTPPHPEWSGRRVARRGGPVSSASVRSCCRRKPATMSSTATCSFPWI